MTIKPTQYYGDVDFGMDLVTAGDDLVTAGTNIPTLTTTELPAHVGKNDNRGDTK